MSNNFSKANRLISIGAGVQALLLRCHLLVSKWTNALEGGVDFPRDSHPALGGNRVPCEASSWLCDPG